MRHTFSRLGTLAKSSQLILDHTQAYSSLLQTLLIIACGWRGLQGSLGSRLDLVHRAVDAADPGWLLGKVRCQCLSGFVLSIGPCCSIYVWW